MWMQRRGNFHASIYFFKSILFLFAEDITDISNELHWPKKVIAVWFMTPSMDARKSDRSDQVSDFDEIF